MSSSFGAKVKQLRKEKGLTLEQLGHKIGAGKSYIWELENRGVTKPSAEKVTKIASALGVTSDFLMDDELESPDNETIDNAYFRKFQKLRPETKKKIQQMIDMWENE